MNSIPEVVGSSPTRPRSAFGYVPALLQRIAVKAPPLWWGSSFKRKLSFAVAQDAALGDARSSIAQSTGCNRRLRVQVPSCVI